MAALARPTDDLVRHCEELADPDMVQFGISLFICVGILVSYLPQHYSLIARRSSAGISPYFVLLGTTSLGFALAYILALPASRADMACCRVNGGLACVAGVLGIAQITVQWACFWLILLLWLLFFPRATPLAPPQALSATPAYSQALAITAICVVHALVLALVNIVLTSQYPNSLQWYANGLGLAATALAVTQYLPQLWTTYSLKSVGSLSIPMMCIQTPGSYVWAASLAVRLGWEGWSIWGLYVVTGTLQGCILVLGIVYEVRERKEKKRAVNGDAREGGRDYAAGSEGGESGGRTGWANEDDVHDETTPLIGTGHRGDAGGTS